MWHLSKKEIHDGIVQKEQEFVVTEKNKKNKKISWLTSVVWFQRYLFKKQYQSFFRSFAGALHEWV